MNKIDWGKKPDSKQLVLCGIVLCIFLYLDCQFLVLGQFSELRKVCARAHKLNKEISQKTSEIISRPDLSSVSVKSAPPAEGGEIPSMEAIPIILRDIGKLSLNNNLKIMQILPQGEYQGKDLPPSATGLAAVNIAIELSGKYNDTAAFIADLESYRYFLQTQDIRIRRDKTDYTRQVINITIRVYVKKNK